jgi:hypothetical protein
MRQRTPLAALSVALVCAGIMSACGDPPLTPARIEFYKGSYTLTMELGDTCSSLPAAARTRTYSATIEDHQRGTPWLKADYLVTLSGATFAAGCGRNSLARGIGCHQFFAKKEGDGLRFSMLDPEWGEGGQVIERLPDGSQLFVFGDGLARLEGSTIEASGTADVYYCDVADEATGRCKSATTYCTTNEFRLRFDRQP